MPDPAHPLLAVIGSSLDRAVDEVVRNGGKAYTQRRSWMMTTSKVFMTTDRLTFATPSPATWGVAVLADFDPDRPPVLRIVRGDGTIYQVRDLALPPDIPPWRYARLLATFDVRSPGVESWSLHMRCREGQDQTGLGPTLLMASVLRPAEVPDA